MGNNQRPGLAKRAEPGGWFCPSLSPKLVQAQGTGFPFIPLSGIDGAGPELPDPPTRAASLWQGQGRLSSGTRAQPGEIWSLLKVLSTPQREGRPLSWTKWQRCERIPLGELTAQLPWGFVTPQEKVRVLHKAHQALVVLGGLSTLVPVELKLL